MATSRISETNDDSSFVCDCSEGVRSACAGEPFYGEHKGKRYCVLHFPSKEKSVDFKKKFQRKLNNKDFDFSGVWFPDDALFTFKFGASADFSLATFSANATFFGATFSAGANFFMATFNADASFFGATFSTNANFYKATFNADANFSKATFKREVNFTEAEFNGEADFEDTSFTASSTFYRTTFKDHVRFAGDEHSYAYGPSSSGYAFAPTSSLDLQFARIEKPDRFLLRTLTLRPYWFVNVDPRKFEFTNIDWHWRETLDEIASLEKSNVSLPHRMLAIACRHLAVNAEENHRYEEASKFRYMAMDARRFEHWGGLDFRRLGWWYWLASGYGERVLRAAIVLIGILIISAALYTEVGFARWEPRLASETDAATAKRDETGAPLKLSRALTYSAAVMTFQRPEPRPATTAAQTIVLLETIFGPVQAALLALAVRRKFMR